MLKGEQINKTNKTEQGVQDDHQFKFYMFWSEKINHANLLNPRFYGIIVFESLESREKYMELLLH